MLKIYSWNVNGLRASLRKGTMQKFLETQHPDILCLQEIKARPEQVDYDFSDYKVFWNPAERAGYSGTATLVSKKLLKTIKPRIFIPIRARKGYLIDQSLIDTQCMIFLSNQPHKENIIAIPEGRILVLDCGDFFLANVYTPNSKPDLARLELRAKDWDPNYLHLLEELNKTKPVITCGDFNAAHEEIDLARPKTNHRSAGFTDEERQGITNIINAGFIDTFRTLHPDEIRYTWWSHWGKSRAKNIGWRIDYFFIPKSLKKNLKSAGIYEYCKGSDHCPISIELDF